MRTARQFLATGVNAGFTGPGLNGFEPKISNSTVDLLRTLWKGESEPTLALRMAGAKPAVTKALYRALLRQANRGSISLVHPVDVSRFGSHSYVAPGHVGELSVEQALRQRGVSLPPTALHFAQSLPHGCLTTDDMKHMVRSAFREGTADTAGVASGLAALRGMSDLRQGWACSSTGRAGDVVVEVTTTDMEDGSPISLTACKFGFCYRVRVHNTGACAC